VTKFFLTLVLAAGMHAALALAQPRYTVTAICEGSANGINNNGDVCGCLFAASGNHAFLFKRGKLTDLGVWADPFYPKDSNSTTGIAVNSSDFVVGSLFDGPSGGNFTHDSFAYLKGKIVPIADGSGDGGFASAAWAVNNAGWVVGSYDAGGTVTNPPALPGAATSRGFLYRNGTTYDIGTLAVHLAKRSTSTTQDKS
jgi:probable HAF family extracellular repeat protein